MPENQVSEKPSQVEVPQQNSFERMQRFLQQCGSKGRSEIATGGIIGDFLVYLQPSFTKPPFTVPAGLMVMQRDVSSAVPPDIFIDLFKVKTKKEQDKDIRGERLVRITLHNPPGVRRERAFIYVSPLLLPRTLVGLCSVAFGLSLRSWKKINYEYVTESEDEAGKIVDTIISHHTKTQSAEGLGVNRRSFLKRSVGVAVGGAAVALASIPDFPKQPSLSPEQDTLAQLKKEVEERFQIKLFDEDQHFAVHDRVPARWKVQQLEQLKRVLPSLPEHFYKPSSETELGVVLIPRGGACCSITHIPGEKATIQFQIQVSKNSFDEGDESILSLLAHEITHYLDIRDYYPGPPGSRLFGTMDESIFEGKFSEVRKELEIRAREMSRQYQKLSSALTLIQPHLVSQEKNLFSILDYMLQRREFAPVFAEQYVRGKQQFFRLFTGLFEQETVVQLYDFIRREIFQGKEY